MPRTSKADHTPESLDAIAGQMRDLADEITGISQALRTAEFPSLTITHYDALTIGVKKLLAFSGAAKVCLFDAKEHRGDFRSQKPVSGRKKTASKNKDLRLGSVSESESSGGKMHAASA